MIRFCIGIINVYKVGLDSYSGEPYGRLTLNENIADNGGIRIAYRAFLKALDRSDEYVPSKLNLTPRQLFWVGYAQDWCLLGGYQSDRTSLGDKIDNKLVRDNI